MRLTAQQTEQIVTAVRRHFGTGARVAVFGSRLNDAARGGDIDLLVESPAAPALLQRAGLTLELEGSLQIPVGIVAVKAGDAGSAFVQAVRPHAAPLDALA